MSGSSHKWEALIPSAEGKMTWLEIMNYVIHEGMQDMEWVLSNNLIRDAARENDKRPAFITLYVPDDWVKNAIGMERFRDLFIVTRVPIELVERMRRLKESKAENGKENMKDSTESSSDAIHSDPEPAPVPSTGDSAR